MTCTLEQLKSGEIIPLAFLNTNARIDYATTCYGTITVTTDLRRQYWSARRFMKANPTCQSLTLSIEINLYGGSSSGSGIKFRCSTSNQDFVLTTPYGAKSAALTINQNGSMLVDVTPSHKHFPDTYRSQEIAAEMLPMTQEDIYERREAIYLNCTPPSLLDELKGLSGTAADVDYGIYIDSDIDEYATQRVAKHHKLDTKHIPGLIFAFD